MPSVPVRLGMVPDTQGRARTFSGGGDTDWTLSTEQTAAGSNLAVPVRT